MYVILFIFYDDVYSVLFLIPKCLNFGYVFSDVGYMKTDNSITTFVDEIVIQAIVEASEFLSQAPETGKSPSEAIREKHRCYTYGFHTITPKIIKVVPNSKI